MFLGISLFFFTPEGLDIAGQFTKELSLYVFLNISLFVPVSLNVGVVFLAMWCVFWVCIVVGWKGPDLSLHNVVRGSFSRPVGHLFRNYLVFFPLVTSMLLLAEIFVQSLQEAHGVPTGSIDILNPYVLFFSASYAAIFEEVGFRLIPIGFTVSLYVLGRSYMALGGSSTLSRRKLTALAFLYPEGAKRRVGLRNIGESGWSRGVSGPEWLIVIATAAAFALAHVLSGAGWGLGKFTLALMVGIVFGLVYVAYGITASILMHWFHNYYLTVYWLSSDVYGASFQAFIWSVEYGIFLFGLVGWVTLVVYLIYRVLTGLLKRRPPPESAITSLEEPLQNEQPSSSSSSAETPIDREDSVQA